MPASPRQIVLCSYHYDPLNQTIGWAPHGAPGIQRFYRKDRLATEIQAAAKYSFFEHDHHVLAQRRQTGTSVDTTLLTTDQQRSVLNTLDATQPNRLAYSPYGHRPQGNGLLCLLGFNGERPDPVTGHYHLGNGYRQFNPVLLRFNSPDSWSPFGRGGLNGYAYCAGDPVNGTDPTGHITLESFQNWIKRNSPKSPSNYLMNRAENVFNGKEIATKSKIVANEAKKSGLTLKQHLLNELTSREESSARTNYDVSNKLIKQADSSAEAAHYNREFIADNTKYINVFREISNSTAISPAEKSRLQNNIKEYNGLFEQIEKASENKIRELSNPRPSTASLHPSAPLDDTRNNIRGSQ